MGLKIKDINHRYWIPTCRVIQVCTSYKQAKKIMSGKDHSEWKYFCMDGKLHLIDKLTIKWSFDVVTFTATEMSRVFPMIMQRGDFCYDHGVSELINW